MDLLAVAPDWYEDAACQGRSTSIWFPGRGEAAPIAMRICAICIVQVECLQYALDNNIHHGIWGGASERARLRMRRGDIE